MMCNSFNIHFDQKVKGCFDLMVKFELSFARGMRVLKGAFSLVYVNLSFSE